MKTVIIQRTDSWGGEYKKYRSTEEQIRQNQRENQIQRERSERARSENAGQTTNRSTDATVRDVGNRAS